MNAPAYVSHASPKRLFLRSHVAAVREAAEAIVRLSGGSWREHPGHRLVALLARLHDLGKGSSAFQRYIAAPDAWRGASIDKAHTPLSLLLTVRYGHAHRWDDATLLAAALAVRGHHGGTAQRGEELSSGLIDDAVFRAVCAQLEGLDLGSLGDEVGLQLPQVDDPVEAIDDARDHLDDALEAFRRRSLADASAWRFVARAAFSVLLEADKAFLAVDTPRLRAYLQRARHPLPPSRVDQLCASLAPTPLDALRAQASREAREGFARNRDARLLTLTLPTGTGKTLIAARWALEARQPDDTVAPDAPLVLVALPMLSIVDQTERVWRAVLTTDNSAVDADTLMASHSLSERSYDTEPDRSTADFYLDTWRSEVVVTTFDQLLLALYSDRGRHAMRYHRLLNASIVLDEVQCIPPALWEPLSRGLHALTTLGATRVLAMSATQPGALVGAVEVLQEPHALYQDLHRYSISLRHEAPTPFDAFVVAAVDTVRDALANGERTLVTVNTRATAQEVFACLDDELRSSGAPRAALLSGDLTPSHRLRVIDDVRNGRVATVVSTQCVEAGVDLDVDRVLRDFCPLDALVQIAGRCNRHNRRATPGEVMLFDLLNPQGQRESEWIYDPVLRDCTRAVLRGRATLDEGEVFEVCAQWFARVAARKDDGAARFEAWTRLREAIDVPTLLRGADRDDESVVVIEQDTDLERDWLDALARGRVDAWDGRSLRRALAPRIAAVSVSVPAWRFATLGVREVGGLSMLLPGQYDETRGLPSMRKS